MSTQAFTCPGEPQIKARPRVTRNGTFTPKATLAEEARIRAAYVGSLTGHAVARPDAEHAYRLLVVSYRYERRRRDGDNMVKLVMDALNGVAYADDSQVEVHAHTTIWVDTRAEARTYVEVERLGTIAAPPRRK